MAYFNNKQNIHGAGYIPLPIPSDPTYNPPDIPTSEEGSAIDIPTPTFVGNAKVTLYNNADESNRVDKRLSNAIEFDIDIKEETSVLNPRIILQSDRDLTFYNYAKINITGRYYYCTVTLIENGLFSIEMNVDVLMSHKVGIRKLIGLVERSQSSAFINKDLVNNFLMNQKGTTTNIIKFGKSLTDSTKYILVTAGAPEAPTPEE